MVLECSTIGSAHGHGRAFADRVRIVQKGQMTSLPKGGNNVSDDRRILRELAHQWAAIARKDRNAEKLRLHRAVNDLEPVRPVVLIDELPWHEMNIDDMLTLRCQDEVLRSVEWQFRTVIYRDQFMPADMIVPPYVSLPKVIRSTGIGVTVEEDIRVTDAANPIISHDYKDILRSDEDLAHLQDPVITYDAAETQRRYQLVGEMIGDIVPLRITGIPYFSVTTWDDISRYRGVNQLLMDLMDRPDFSHRVVRRITDIYLAQLEQYESLGLFDHDPQSLHCTPIHTSDLPRPGDAEDARTRRHIWGRGTAQIFASVSKRMHAEFDIEYMKETVGQCGLVYYGCCEPLDTKMDIVEQIPNLRKVGVTPWADVNRATEAIQDKYVVSAKPNPAAVAVERLDVDHLRQEIGEILAAVKRNNCACDIVLKDISTCRQRPENIFQWEQTVMEMVQGM